MKDIFGWDLPPGCNIHDLPYEDEYPCEICHEFPENCKCPECDICGFQGNPICLNNHMSITEYPIIFCKKCGEPLSKPILRKSDEKDSEDNSIWYPYCRQCIENYKLWKLYHCKSQRGRLKKGE